MRYLIDTHALIWWWEESEDLPDRLRDLFGDRRNDIFVSAASGWEIATKVRAGKLPSMTDHVHNFASYVSGDGFQHLAVTHEHGVHGGLLPGAHRDPFDRLLAAQSLVERLFMVSRDRAFGEFGCEVVW